MYSRYYRNKYYYIKIDLTTFKNMVYDTILFNSTLKDFFDKFNCVNRNISYIILVYNNSKLLYRLELVNNMIIIKNIQTNTIEVVTDTTYKDYFKLM